MTIKEEQQFMVDPVVNPTEFILVPQGWLQNKLRQAEKDAREVAIMRKTYSNLQEQISGLRMKLMIAQSEHPYTILNVRG